METVLADLVADGGTPVASAALAELRESRDGWGGAATVEHPGRVRVGDSLVLRAADGRVGLVVVDRVDDGCVEFRGTGPFRRR